MTPKKPEINEKKEIKTFRSSVIIGDEIQKDGYVSEYRKNYLDGKLKLNLRNLSEDKKLFDTINNIRKSHFNFGESKNEILIPGDMFDFAWAEDIDKNLPTLVTVIGVFQYFAEEKVIRFLKQLKTTFPGVEVIFDAMTGKAIKYANDYIKKTGNNDAELHFNADNGKSVAEKCGMKLVEERPFFGAARKQLKRKLKLYTRIAMKVVDEGGRRGFLTHLQG